MLTANSLARRGLGRVKVQSATQWQPDPDNAPQCLAYELADKVDELGYGGQAGGGKTDLILGLAGTKFKNSMILRREFPQLRWIIKRGNAIFPANFVSGERKEWNWGDTVVSARSMQYEADWEKYQGTPIQFLGIDEATQFSENAVRIVSGWVRAEPGAKTLVVMTFNPPTTPEGEWVLEYFAPWLDPEYPNPAQPGEIRYFASIVNEHGRDVQIEVDSIDPFEHNGGKVYPVSRTYVPASRHDNKHLGEEYEKRLNNLPEPYRSLLKTGIMNVSVSDQEWQLIPTAWVENAQARWKLMKTQSQGKMTSLGVDVARGGKDDTTIAPLYGTWFDEIIAYPGEQSPNGQVVRDQVMAHYKYPAKIGIDVVGVGGSPYDFLTANYLLEVHAINAGAGGHGTDTSGTLKFANMRARMFWKLREALDPNSGLDIALPPSRQLRRELTAMRYSIPKKIIRIEKKEDIKKRLGRSPDMADAVALAWEVRDYQSNTSDVQASLANYRGLISE